MKNILSFYMFNSSVNVGINTNTIDDCFKKQAYTPKVLRIIATTLCLIILLMCFVNILPCCEEKLEALCNPLIFKIIIIVSLLIALILFTISFDLNTESINSDKLHTYLLNMQLASNTNQTTNNQATSLSTNTNHSTLITAQPVTITEAQTNTINIGYSTSGTQSLTTGYNNQGVTTNSGYNNQGIITNAGYNNQGITTNAGYNNQGVTTNSGYNNQGITTNAGYNNQGINTNTGNINI